MPTFYDLLKYAKTGIAAPDMTAYDKLKAMAMCGGGLSPYTIIGQPPISFLSDGTPLTSVTIKGNGQQNGTPSPDNPVMPTFCGVRTGNLLNLNRTYSESFTTDTTKWMNGTVTIKNAGIAYAETEILGDVIKVTSKSNGYGASFLIEASPNTTYTVSFETDKTSSSSYGGISDRDINGTVISSTTFQGKSATFTTHSDCAFLNVCFRFPPADGTVTFSKIMLNIGSTALPYEPFGYKIPLTCASQTTPLYLGEVSTTRRIKKLVLTGEEDWEKSSSYNTYFLTTIADYAHVQSNITVCTHYPSMQNVSAISGVNDGYVCWTYDTSADRLYSRDDIITSLADWKQFLRDQYAAGTPVTLWYVLATPETGIVNEPLMKIGDYADELTTTTPIPTAKGSNTLTVDTTVQPSEVSITGNIKPTT